jgi:hypothetical protein
MPDPMSGSGDALYVYRRFLENDYRQKIGSAAGAAIGGDLTTMKKTMAPRTWEIENVVFVEFQPARVPEVLGQTGCALTDEYSRILDLVERELRHSPHGLEINRTRINSGGFDLSVQVCPQVRKLGTAVPFRARCKDVEASPA